MKRFIFVFFPFLPLLLVSCAGGASVTTWSNGGAVTPSPTPTPPVPSPTPVNPGTFVTAVYTSFSAGVAGTIAAPADGGSAILSLDPNTQAITQASFISGDAIPNIAAFTTTPTGSSPADTIAVFDGHFTSFLSNQGNDIVALAPTPSAVGWNYQTFGVWASGAGPGSISAVSYGTSVTPNANVPQTGTATYSGFAAGIFMHTIISYVTANVTAQVDFANGSIAFSTSNTAISNSVTTPNLLADSGLDINGTLKIQAATNSFTGPVGNSNSSNLQGTATGKFYGPAAQELGGVFAIKNSSGFAYVGAFGAKK